MTEDEQNNEISINFIKCNDLHREVCCITRRLERLSAILRETADALDRKTTQRTEISFDSEFPTLQEIQNLCSDHDRADAELQRVRQFLGSVTTIFRAETPK